MLRWHFVKAGAIGKPDKLSTRFIWMAAKETDEFMSRPTTFIESDGTSLKAALDIARRYGVVLDRLLPFKSRRLYPGGADTFYAIAAQLRIASYFNLGRDLTQWRIWLANNGPILTRLNVDATWDNARSTGGNLDTYQPATTRGGHAVALVGYTADRFIVRNSWGTQSWGDKVFGYASVSYAQIAFTEALRLALARAAAPVRTPIVCPFFVATGMFAGARTRFPRLLPILEPAVVAARIVDAIEADRARLVLPAFVTSTWLLRLLPVAWFDAAMGFFGITRSMDDFTGRGGTPRS